MIRCQEITFDKLTSKVLRKQLCESPSREVCGALGGMEKNDGIQVTSVYPVQNQSKRSNGFALSVCSLADAVSHFEKIDSKLLGIYHSHPSGILRPSLRDLWLVRNTGIPLIIIVQRHHSFEAVIIGPTR